MACGASKFQTFEMLARAILITKAPNNKAQASAMYAYNNAKSRRLFCQTVGRFYGCDDINRRFDSQPIYEATLYADGSIKMPDGKLFTPRRPYDATLLYKDRNDRTTAQKIYDRGKKIKPATSRSKPTLRRRRFRWFIPALPKSRRRCRRPRCRPKIWAIGLPLPHRRRKISESGTLNANNQSITKI